MAEEDTKQVEVRGLDNKREIWITVCYAIWTASLPSTLLYAGKTPRCNPHQSFPSGWDIYHSPTHWSTEDTMLHFVKDALLLRIPWPFSGSKGPCNFWCFAAHRVASLKELLTEANIMFVYIPASCTLELQPLDKSTNDPYKKELEQCFIDWYASEVKR